MRIGLVLIAIITVFAGGCTPREEPEAIPRYPLTSPDATIRQLADRAKRVRTLSAEGLITLTRPDGQTVRLDGVLAMRPPDHARLRATKFGRAVFDLTIKPEGVWMAAPDDPGRKEQVAAAGASAAKLARTWAVLSGGFFEPNANLQMREQGDQLIVRRTAPGEPVVVCTVDRPTLTPRKYELLDDAGAVRFTMAMDRYRQFADVAWPMRMTATSEGGVVVVELREAEVNPDLPAAAFDPPRRAERLP